MQRGRGVVRTERLSARATSVAMRMAKDSSRKVASCANLAFLASSIPKLCCCLSQCDVGSGGAMPGPRDGRNGMLGSLGLGRRALWLLAWVPCRRACGCERRDRGRRVGADEQDEHPCVFAAYKWWHARPKQAKQEACERERGEACSPLMMMTMTTDMKQTNTRRSHKTPT